MVRMIFLVMVSLAQAEHRAVADPVPQRTSSSAHNAGRVMTDPAIEACSMMGPWVSCVFALYEDTKVELIAQRAAQKLHETEMQAALQAMRTQQSQELAALRAHFTTQLEAQRASFEAQLAAQGLLQRQAMRSESGTGASDSC